MQSLTDALDIHYQTCESPLATVPLDMCFYESPTSAVIPSLGHTF